MSPLRKFLMRVSGKSIPDPFDDVMFQLQQLKDVARTLRQRIESYHMVPDPFMAMIEDVWNARQQLLNGHDLIS